MFQKHAHLHSLTFSPSLLSLIITTEGLTCFQTGRDESFCAWTLIPEHPSLLVIEDAFEDVRFKDNALVTGPPNIRFYAGCPLISSGGNAYRYGSLCVIDTRPRHDIPAELYNLLVQFAELVVREIEKEKLTLLQSMVTRQFSMTASSDRSSISELDNGNNGDAVDGLRRSDQAMSTTSARKRTSASPTTTKNRNSNTASAPKPAKKAMMGGLIRAADCFMEGVFLLDVRHSEWKILYTNEAANKLLGVPTNQQIGESFWSTFHSPGIEEPSSHFAQDIAGQKPFTMMVETTVGSVAATSGEEGRSYFTIDLRPAAIVEKLHPSQPLVGIPSNIGMASLSASATGERAPLFYFAIMRAGSMQSTHVACTPATALIESKVSRAMSLDSNGVGATAAAAGGVGALLTPPPSQRLLNSATSTASLSGAHSDQLTTATNASALTRDYSLTLPKGMMFKKSSDNAFVDVRLGPLIGRGAYGKVYRGTWNGNTVAVKVIEMSDSKLGLTTEELCIKNPIFEAVLSSNLSHPNVVQTYLYATRPINGTNGLERAQSWEPHSSTGTASMNSGGGGGCGGNFDGTTNSAGVGLFKDPETAALASALTEVWLVSEYCNRGPLLTAIERGAFLTQPATAYGQPNLIAVLQTLQELAAAMAYLHSNNILHGDLTGGNVLLTASDKDARGFTSKVVDFGLSRVMQGEYMRTKTLGCAEYMPHELITQGILTKAADVYAFGVITWEIYLGKRAWEGLKPSEVLRKVANKEQLKFPSHTPHRLRVLGEKCMAIAPTERPTMNEVLNEVNAILEDTMGILQQFLAASTAGDGILQF